MRKLKMDKKGVLGMDLAQKFVLALLTLVIIGVVVIIVVANLGTNTGLSGTSQASVTAITNNVSTATEGFFGNATTWFAMLAIAVLILIIAVVILAVRGFGGRGGL